MKKRILAGLTLATALWALSAWAQNSANCGFISDNDERNMCRALAERQSSYCGFISDNDKRNHCRAQAERNPSYCGFISDNNKRNMCRALAGG